MYLVLAFPYREKKYRFRARKILTSRDISKQGYGLKESQSLEDIRSKIILSVAMVLLSKKFRVPLAKLYIFLKTLEMQKFEVDSNVP